MPPSGLQMTLEKREIQLWCYSKNRRASTRRFGPTARIPIRRRDPICLRCQTRQSQGTLHEGASYQSIPGHPRWMMAPIEMAWQGKSIGDICRQIKDPTRNGGHDLALLHDHLAKDDLVAWGWQPGVARESAPGNQALLGELVQAWTDTGAQRP
jgi:hypothetical protein